MSSAGDASADFSMDLSSSGFGFDETDNFALRSSFDGFALGSSFDGFALGSSFNGFALGSSFDGFALGSSFDGFVCNSICTDASAACSVRLSLRYHSFAVLSE